MATDHIPFPVRTRLRDRRSSRYQSSTFYPTLGGMYGRFPFNPNTFPPHQSDRYKTIEAGDVMQWTGLAYEHLGSAFLWWVLALCNGVIDPISGVGVSEGDVIRIPSVSRVLGILQVS